MLAGFIQWDWTSAEQFDCRLRNASGACGRVNVRLTQLRGGWLNTKVRPSGLPYEGYCYNCAQAGLVIYGDDDNFVKLASVSIWETRQTEFAKELIRCPKGGAVTATRWSARPATIGPTCASSWSTWCSEIDCSR